MRYYKPKKKLITEKNRHKLENPAFAEDVINELGEENERLANLNILLTDKLLELAYLVDPEFDFTDQYVLLEVFDKVLVEKGF